MFRKDGVHFIKVGSFSRLLDDAFKASENITSLKGSLSYLYSTYISSEVNYLHLIKTI